MRLTVPLTQQAIDTASEIAKRRNASHRASGRADGIIDRGYGSLSVDVDGAIGEYVVACALGVAWDGDFKDIETWEEWRRTGHDVSGLEVRTTTHPSGRLIVQPTNDNARAYVLVVIDWSTNTVYLPGWAWGHEVKKESNWMSHWPKPTYAMVQSELRPVSELLRYKSAAGFFSPFNASRVPPLPTWPE